MALYQPSNITPSSFAGLGGGVVDVNDDVSVSWQVNGTSAMIGVNIVINENPATGTPVHTFNQSVSPGFYGTDADGNARFYVFEPGSTWASVGLTNGKSYQMSIRQTWTEKINGSWVSSYVDQVSPTVFITRAKPTLSVSPAAGTLTSVAQTFSGTYEQTQGDSVANVRWILTNGSGEVVDDTGTIYTGELKYTYNGFFSGESYTLSCTVETENGVSVTATNAYTVSYSSASASGGITLSCNLDDSVSVSWMGATDIPGTPTPDSSYGSIVDGVLHLNASYAINWSTVNGEPMSFTGPYAAAWRGRIGTSAVSSRTISSSGWELWKENTMTGTTTVSKTVSSLSLTKPYTNNASETVTSNTLTSITYDLVPASESLSASYFDGQYNVELRPNNIFDIVDIVDVVLGPNTTSYAVHYTELGIASIQLFGNSSPLSFTGKYKRKKYTGVKSFTPSQPGATNVTISDYTCVTANIEAVSGGGYLITYYAKTGGTYDATVSYTYQTTGNDSYSGSVTDTLSASTGTLTNATILSTTGTGGATVTKSGNSYTVTIRNSSSSSCTASVLLTYTYKTIGNDSYRSVVTGVLQAGEVSASVTSTTAYSATVDVDTGKGTYTLTFYNGSMTSQTATVAFNKQNVIVSQQILTMFGTSVLIKSDDSPNEIILSGAGISDTPLPIPDGAHTMFVWVTPTRFAAKFYDVNNVLIRKEYTSIDFSSMTDLYSVNLKGEQWCDYLYITSNVDYDFEGNEANPVFDGSTLFYAPFTADLQAGSISSAGDVSLAMYRREGTRLTPLGLFDGDTVLVKDYGIRSQKEYTYLIYYVTDGVYSNPIETDKTICRQFRQFTLIEAEQDADDQSIYHPVSVWRFRNNIEAGAVSNGNTPALLDNFTKYPYWQPSSPAAKSGTLTALLSFFSEGEYIRETAEDMERLYALSQSVNPLFLRDLKGNLYMVRLSGPISQTVNYKTGVMEVTVTVPWIEVGDAENVKILSVGG